MSDRHSAQPLQTGSQEYDPWDGDYPVFDPKCPKCARFYSYKTIRYQVNGAGEVLNAQGECKRCGPIPASVTHWHSDEVMFA